MLAEEEGGGHTVAMLQVLVSESTGAISFPATAFLDAASRVLRLRRRPALHRVPGGERGIRILNACVEDPRPQSLQSLRQAGKPRMLQMQDAKSKGRILRVCLEDTEGQSLQNLRDAGEAPVLQVQHAEDERRVLRVCLEAPEGPHL